MARRASEFANRNVEVIGISVNSLEDHYKWIQDINDYGSKVGPTDVRFPIVSTCSFDPFSAHVTSFGIRIQIADEDRKISTLYEMPRRAGCHESQCQRSSFCRMFPPLKKSKSNTFAIDSLSLRDRPKEGHSSYNLLSCVNRQEYR